MAKVLKPKTLPSKNFYLSLSLVDLRKEYEKLLKLYESVTTGFYCHNCGTFLPASSFYKSTKTASGVIPTCRDCILKIGTNFYDTKNPGVETIQSLKKALKVADVPYVQKIYDTSVSLVNDENSKSTAKTIIQQYMALINISKQYAFYGYADSEGLADSDDDREIQASKTLRNEARKIFGDGYSDEDYIFLIKQYKDWTTRHECQTKSQEETFKRICCKQLEIHKASIQGRNTKDLDRSLQEWLDTGNLKPKQNSMEGLSDAQTLGTLIQKWENERPLPEIDPELKDVDKIGLYIDVFFKGHLCKMLNLKNNLSHLYENFMEKYAAKKPEYNEDMDSETLFDLIFGKGSTD